MNKGFSLFELLIVLSITSILVFFSYLHYQDYVVRARRADGKLALLDLANRLEHYYFEHQTYRTATLGIGRASDILSSSLSPERWYQLSIISTDLTYTLLAIPIRTQTGDKDCQTFTLDNRGVQSIQAGTQGAPLGTALSCWQ